MKDRRGTDPAKKKYRILAAASTCVMLVCVVWLAKTLLDDKRAQEQTDRIRDSYVSVGTSAAGSGEGKALKAMLAAGRTQAEAVLLAEEKRETEEAAAQAAARQAALDAEADRLALMERYAVPDKTVDFAALHTELTTDIYAWITIPDTLIDYPVLQNAEDTDYYLTHNIDGSGPRPGCIYSQNITSKDFTDRNTVLYGHNMGKTMFHDLHKFADPEFFDRTPYVYLYTEECILVYQVFAACRYSSVHLLLGIDTSTEEAFLEYIDSLYAADGISNNFNTELREEMDGGSLLLTLSTCTNPTREDVRWLVSAVLAQKIPYRDEEALAEAALK